jgi:hypothetical protein
MKCVNPSFRPCFLLTKLLESSVLCVILQLGPAEQASRMCHGYYNGQLQAASKVRYHTPSSK